MDSNAFSAPSLADDSFRNNFASRDGGGLYLFGSDPTLNHVTFVGNSAYSGGGMSIDASSPVLTEVVFRRNSAWRGGGMHNSSGSPTMRRVALLHNSACRAGGGLFNDRGSPMLVNCDLRGNSAPIGPQVGGTPA